MLFNPCLQALQTLLPNVRPARFESIAQELKSFPRLPSVADVRFVRVQRQAVGLHPCPYPLQCCIRLAAGTAQDDEVVGVAHHARLARLHQYVEWVQIDVGQWRALRQACRGLMTAPCGVPPVAVQRPASCTMSALRQRSMSATHWRKSGAVTEPLFYALHQRRVRDAVKVAL